VGFGRWNQLGHQPHQGIKRFFQEVNHLYRTETALYDNDLTHEGFRWIDANNSDESVLVYMRINKAGTESIIVVCNLTPVPRFGYRIGVPDPGFYSELINSDAVDYWGSGMGNYGGVQSENVAWHGHYHSISLTLPPLSTMMFKLKGQGEL
jgi:1,4-alpha-glucan branching enzyme